jgi:hypothetical protein
MVARINTGKNISKVLNYNEHKVSQKEAEILWAENFLKDAKNLSFSDKIRWFEKFTSLNERATTNTLHVSLNFDSSEKLDNDKLVDIAKMYMEKIGFGEQPYLIYRHYDAGHPHIHIVSMNIRRDGSRISMHNIGRNQSEKARKEIENDFALVKAQEKKQDASFKLIPVSAQKVALGKSSVKRAVSNVLGVVINQYRYSSLPELNAVLQLYNVSADRGEKGSVMYDTNGLVYRVLDEKGNKISPPIKASSFYMKPTLKNLEQKFSENESLKAPHAKRLRASIEYAFIKRSNMSLPHLIADLNQERISTVIRQNKDGIIYGITYVDHKSKCVFNGSDLGKAYSAKMILERCNIKENNFSASWADEKKNIHRSESFIQPISNSQLPATDVIDTLMKPEIVTNYMPYELKKAKRKRKKKRLII